MVPSVVVVAGLAVSMSITDYSDAVSTTILRNRLGIAVWQDEGITGKNAIIGSLDGLPPLVAPLAPFGTHQAFAKSNIVTIVFENDGIPRRTFANILLHEHQTATLGAMVASKVGTASDAPIGFASEAQTLVGWFALDRAPAGGFTNAPLIRNRDGQIFDAVTFSLLGMTGQDYADVISNDLGLSTPYQVATVVNSSFGSAGVSGRRGEDQFDRIYNAVAEMTGATLIAPTSNDGNLQPPTSDMDDPTLTSLGYVYSPGSAHNTIAVGFIDRNLSMLVSDSGKGPMQAVNYADEGFGSLYPIDNMSFVNPFTPTDGPLESMGGVFIDSRPGVDIVAPGEFIELPGNTFVLSGSSVFSTVSSSEWSGSSFASAIVTASCGLLHELGEREGYSIHNVVTRAVLLNSANKTDTAPGVGFDNEQTTDQMDVDRASVTTIALDMEIGSGSLDLKRLIRQYYLGAVITDYKPGDGIVGATLSGAQLMQDSLSYTTEAPGTDPNIPFVVVRDSSSANSSASPRQMNQTCQMSLGGAMISPLPYESRDPWLDGRVETRIVQQYGPFDQGVESLIDRAIGSTMPMARRDSPDLDGDEPDLGSGDNNGIPGASGDDIESSGGGGGGIQAYRSGWDHGNLGEGYIDLPIGPITPNSGISVTLTWNRHEILNLPPFMFANASNGGDLIAFGSADSAQSTDPRSLMEYKFEDLNLELWQVPNGTGANKLLAASRSVWNNTECVFFDYTGGAPDGSSNGPFGNSPANCFVRVLFDKTLWDYGGFWFCNGGMSSIPLESESKVGFLDLPRAQVEYGLAWYVEMNTDGYPDLRRATNPETGAVDVSIVGLRTNLDSQFAPLLGDLNADFLVDVNDAALLIQNFGSIDPNYDLNNDGIADALDLQMISQHVGETAEPMKLSNDEKKAERQRRKDYKKQVNDRRKANKKASKILQKKPKESRRR